MRVSWLLVVLAFCAAGCEDEQEATQPWLTAPDRTSHDRFFPIAAAPHDADCDRCHGAADSFETFDCLGCHQDPATSRDHAGVEGFAYESRACYGCHPRGTATAAPSDHARFFPIGDATPHAAVGCAGCHASTTDRSLLQCAGCHTHEQTRIESEHAQVAGFAWAGTGTAASARCVRCHADGQVDRVARHLPFALLPPSKHRTAPCLDCHVTARTDKPWGQDFAQKSCTGCHSEARDRIVTQHAGVDGFALSTAACLTCHPDGGPAGNLDHARFFPIAAGATHALGSTSALSSTPVACSSCHTATGDRTRVDCTGCHTRARTDPAHTGRVVVGGYTWDADPVRTSAQCVRCHGDEQVNRVASHTPFSIASGTPHFQASCLGCHPDARTDKPFAADFRRADCASCHSEALDGNQSRHAGVSGFSTAGAECVRCHPSGGPTAGFRHPAFPMAAGQPHAYGAPAVHLAGSITCRSCHTSATDRSAIDCARCHADTAPAHVRVGGFAADRCLACHADAQVDRIATHLPFSLAAGSAHAGSSCLTCHPTSRTDKPFGRDFAGKDCLACHTEALDRTVSRHNGIEGFVLSTAACLGCHPDGGPSGNLDHANLFPIAAMEPHALGSTSALNATPIACASCHTTPGDYSRVECTTCHVQANVDPTHAGRVAGYTWQASSGPCLRCHADGQVDRIASHLPFRLLVPSNHTTAACLTCHDAARTDKPQGQDFRRQSCAGCHSEALDANDTRHASVAGYGTRTADCLRCHPDGGPTSGFVHAAFPVAAGQTHAVGAAARNVAGTIGCRSCHTSATSSSQIACTTCHPQAAMTAPHTGVGGYAWQSPLCLRCHADGQVDRMATHLPFRITGTGARHRGESCLRCHPQRRTDKPFGEDFRTFDCRPCHPQGETDSQHRGRPGYAYVSTTCVQAGCHPDGRSD